MLTGLSALMRFGELGLHWVADRHADWERHEALRPPPALTIRPADYDRYPRASFAFILDDGNGNLVDTFTGRVSKDLVGTPDTTIALTLTASEMDTIYRAVIAMRLFEFTEPYPAFRSGATMVPATHVRLMVRAGGAKRELTWSSGMVSDGPPSNDWKRIYALVKLIRRTVAAHPEYQNLPKPNGYYE